MTRLRLVSLNAWGGAVWDELRDWVPTIGADILCLQEMTRAPVPSPDWLQYADAYRRLDQRADLFGDISGLLPDHQSSFAPAARGDLHADEAFRSEHGLGLWVGQSLAVVESRTSFVYGDFRPDGWGEEPVPRAIQGQRIWDPGSGRTILVAHFHGLRDPSGKGDTPGRRTQSRAARDFISAMSREGEPVVLAGDFNILPDNPFFDEMAGIGLTDLVTSLGHTDTRTWLYKKPQRYANYMLVNDQARVYAFDAPAEPVVSDHRPLILDLEL